MSNPLRPRFDLDVLEVVRSGGCFTLKMAADIKVGKNPGTGRFQFLIYGNDCSVSPITANANANGRAIATFPNLKAGGYRVEAIPTVPVFDKPEKEETLDGILTQVNLPSPDFRLETSEPVKIGNGWRVTATVTSFVPQKSISAEGEEVKLFVDGKEVASGPTNDAGIFSQDLPVDEGKRVIEAILTSTTRKRQSIIQVGEKASGPKRIIYSTTSKLGYMGTTILRITVVNEKGTGVKDKLVRIEDPTLLSGCAEYTTNGNGEIIHEGSVSQAERFRGIAITVPGTDLRESINLCWQTE